MLRSVVRKEGGRYGVRVSSRQRRIPPMSNDLTVVRDLAQRYAEEAARPIQDRRRDLWLQHNSRVRTLPLIYVRAFAWSELPDAKCVCEDAFYRSLEGQLRQ